MDSVLHVIGSSFLLGSHEAIIGKVSIPTEQVHLFPEFILHTL